MLFEIGDASAESCVFRIFHLRPTTKIDRSETKEFDLHPPFLVLENHPNGDRNQQINEDKDQHNTTDQCQNRWIGLKNETRNERDRPE